MDVDASAPVLTLSPPSRPHSAPAAPILSRPKQFSWNPTDAAHLGPSRITITRLYQRAPKAPYHHLQPQPRLAQQTAPKSPGPQKKKRCVSLDAGPDPFHLQDSFSDPSDAEDADPVILQDLRSSSAPPENTNTPEPIPKPRISDDTAILHAFLSRAAASKRPMAAHKRESLENRRDSDVVRHALASTDKPEVLTDLDPNSPPLPPKEPSDDTNQKIESTKEESAVELPSSTPTKSKAPRRTTRTRTPVAAPKKPAKIAIRSAADHIALKRTEAQELALLTRSNTRKNKGKSIMPQARLLNIGDDIVSFEDSTEETAEAAVAEKAQSGRSAVRRGVQWNENLTHVREFESDSPDSPPKAKTRTSRVSARALEPFVPLTSAEEPLEEVALESAAMEVDNIEPKSQSGNQPPKESTPRAKAVPLKRKSRIATPARSSKLAVPKPVSTAPLLPPATSAPQPSEPLTTSLGTPKKPPTPFTALKAPSLSSRLEFAPPKNNAAGSAAAHTSSLPGLSSPAKKRVRTTLGKSAVRPATGQDESELPGLTSPAKRKRAGVKFS
ncbi:hypothetical protein QM012_006501 [Aureobasidium pullulans]|uniref:Uncharacterized protein n=1 Tax=Aureobasidium pullulans TaxID=5580 RepID=A0ABR0TNU5_AURPU